MLNVIMLSVAMLGFIMVNVTHKPFMLNVFMLSVAMLNVIMLNVTYKPFMLNVIMLDVVMLSVVAPIYPNVNNTERELFQR